MSLAVLHIAVGQNVTPLHKACIFGHLAIVKRLIEAGGQIGAADSNGDTPLHYAARCGFPLVTKYLVEAQAPMSKNAAGQTPKECAATPAIAQLFP
jgi:ankyrin repeat protein